MKYPIVSRDFIGQGIANLAVSLFQGLPVGSSALNALADAGQWLASPQGEN